MELIHRHRIDNVKTRCEIIEIPRSGVQFNLKIRDTQEDIILIKHKRNELLANKFSRPKKFTTKRSLVYFIFLTSWFIVVPRNLHFLSPLFYLLFRRNKRFEGTRAWNEAEAKDMGPDP